MGQSGWGLERNDDDDDDDDQGSPMALSLGVGVVEVAGGAFSSLSVIVDVEGFREKPERGPRWVSFNSVGQSG